MTKSAILNLAANTDALVKRPLLAVFDRDGTLAPLTDDPYQAPILSKAKQLVLNLSKLKDVSVAVLSARSLAHLRQDFGDELLLAGNYGLEMGVGDKQIFLHPTAVEAKDNLVRAKERLGSLLEPRTKVIIEDHGLSLCVHWRQTPQALLDKVHVAIAQVKEEFPDLRVRDLSIYSVYEIWPPVYWNKAHALDRIKETFEPKEWFYFYAGDSLSDEPAFRWVNAHNGISVRVGEDLETEAKYRLQSPLDLESFLDQLVGLRSAVK